MLEIKNNKFREKFTEINIRQRMYQNKNFITLMVTTEFFPSLVGENLVSGLIDLKVDLEGISSLDDLCGKEYDGEIGSLTISVNNDGFWEHQSYKDFKFFIKKRNGREFSFKMEGNDCILDTVGVMVSLYTTSTSLEDLDEVFDLSDFYEKPVVKDVGTSKISKFFVKE